MIRFPFLRREVQAVAGRAPLSPTPILKPYAQRFSLRVRILGWSSLLFLAVFCVVGGFYYALTTPFMLKEFILGLVPLALIVIWVLPASKTIPQKSMEGFFWAIYLSTMLWPNYLAIALPGLPWISAVRLTGFPLALLVLVATSQSATFRKQMADTVGSVPKMLTFQVAFVVIQILTTAVSKAKGDSIDAIVDNVIGWASVFFVASWLFLKPGRVERWAAYMCWASVLLCFIGIWEARLEHPVWAGHVPPIFQIQDEYVQRVLAGSRRLGEEYRVQGTQSTSLGFSEHLALATPFFLHFALGDGYKLWTRVAAAVCLPLVFTVILSTQARLGVLGFMLGGLLYVGFWAMQRWRASRHSLVGPAVLAAYPAFFVAFITASFFVGRIRRMVWGSGETQASDEARREQLRLGIPKVLTHPWGYGTARGADELGYAGPSGIVTIDNYFLLVALDWGILGFIVYYGMIVMAVWASGRELVAGRLRTREQAWLIPVTIALIEFFVIKTIFSQTHNHKLEFMMLGMVCALLYRIKFGVPGEELPPKGAQA